MEEENKLQEKAYQDIEDFIKKQKDWLNVEHEEEKIQHQKTLEENTPVDLQKLGIAIVKLKCKSIKQGLYGRVLLTFTHLNYNDKAFTSETFAKMVKLPEVKIQAGDNVGIYKQKDGGVQFLNQKPLVSGVIYRKNEYKLVLSIDSKDGEDDIFDIFDNNSQNIYSMILEVNEVTYQRYMQAIKYIEKISQDSNHPSRHMVSILLGQTSLDDINHQVKRADILDRKKQNQLNWSKKDMNDEQKDSIEFALSRESLSLIHGPPGTGKTMTVCELITQGVKKGFKVLATAGSNIAVDNIVERLSKNSAGVNVIRIGHPARLLNSIKDRCLDAQVRNSSSYKILKDSKQQLAKIIKQIQKCKNYDEKKELKGQMYGLRKEIRGLEKTAVKEVVQDAQVICCTNTGAADKIFRYELADTQFDLVVIDEAAQALEISCWLPILKGKRVVLAGDHKQLPPTVKSKNNNLSFTLFDRIIKEFEEEKVSRILRVQYRMNHLIMDWSSQAVYKGQLKAAESVKDRSLQNLREDVIQDENCVLMLLDTAGAKMGENIENPGDKTRSKSNQGECDLVRIMVSELQKQGLKDNEIGIITPYNAQVDLIRQTLNNADLEISTVDGFQGREKECIIISMVRSNPLKQVGFLSDYRRMNVAITRAKRFVCLIGDSDTVNSDKFLQELVQYFEQNGEVRSAFEFQRADENIAFNSGFINMPQNQALKKIDSAIENVNTNTQNDEQNKNKKKKKNKNKNKDSVNNDQFKKQEQQQQQQQEQIKQDQNQGKTEEIIKIADIQVKEDKTELLEREDLEKEYGQKLQEFKDSKQKELVFDKLNGFQRMIIHEISDQLQLKHVSKGSSKLKKIIITNENSGQNQTEKQNEKQKQQPKKENLNKPKKKKKQTEEEKKKEQEMDDFAFLDEQIKKNKICGWDHCKSNVELLGVDCKFCGERFCMKHGLAEQHGCDYAAKKDARETFKEKAYKQIKPQKFVSEQEKNFMRLKLQESLKKQQNQRRTQTKKDKENKD